jgi:hypothetical protein
MCIAALPYSSNSPPYSASQFASRSLAPSPSAASRGMRLYPAEVCSSRTYSSPQASCAAPQASCAASVALNAARPTYSHRPATHRHSRTLFRRLLPRNPLPPPHYRQARRLHSSRLHLVGRCSRQTPSSALSLSAGSVDSLAVLPMLPTDL